MSYLLVSVLVLMEYACLLAYFLLMGAIFYFPLIHTSNSLRSSLIVLPDPENEDSAVGNQLLSCIQTEICVKSYLLPVTSRHL